MALERLTHPLGMERTAKVRRLCEDAYKAEVELGKSGDSKLSTRIRIETVDDEFYGRCIQLAFSLAKYGEPVLQSGGITVASPIYEAPEEGDGVATPQEFLYVVRRKPRGTTDRQEYSDSGNWALEVHKDESQLVVARYDSDTTYTHAADEAMSFIAQSSLLLEELRQHR